MSGVSKRGELKVLEQRHFTNSSREVTGTFTPYVAVTDCQDRSAEIDSFVAVKAEHK